MAKRKYPSELNTKQIRVNIGTWLLLTELSQKNGITMADAVDLLITGLEKPVALIAKAVSTALPRMPAFSYRAKPALSVNGQATAIPVLSLRAKPALSVNGQVARHTALSIKPKGGKNE